MIPPEDEIIQEIEILIPGAVPKERLDKYLASLSEVELSRSKIQKLIKEGLVTVDDIPAEHNQSIQGGERIAISIPAPPPSKARAEDIPLDIRYEDDDVIVINKPPGMVTHPAAGNYSGTLVNALLYHTENLSGVQGELRPGIIHRLDKNTSGLLIAAKNDRAHLFLQKELQERRIKRTYSALVCGHFDEEEGVIDLPIGRSMKDRKKMAVTNRKSRPAVTHYKLSERFRLYDLLEVNLETGRTHQIRVHFAHLGHPVFGDPEYGGRLKWHRGIYQIDKVNAQKALKMFDRQALHAVRLEFRHPSQNRSIVCESELPDDFAYLLEFLRNLPHQ